MITTTSKPAIVSIRPTITLLALALTVALVLGLAALALVLPAGASAQVPGATPIRNLRLEFVEAYKHEGYQPLDVLARVVDGDGIMVTDAQVRVTIDEGISRYDIILMGIDKGYYLGCDLVEVGDLIEITVEAQKKEWTSASATVKAQAANLCSEGELPLYPSKPIAQAANLYDNDNRNDGCEPQLYVSEPKAAKPDGEKEALDLSVQLTDDYGNPVVGAKVMARATDFETFVDAPLTDMGNGRYSACAFGYFKGWGEGAVRIHIRAEKSGYTPGAGDGSNYVGRLCAVSGTGPSR